MTHLLSSMEREFIIDLLDGSSKTHILHETLLAVGTYEADGRSFDEVVEAQFYYLGELSSLQNMPVDARGGADYQRMGRRLWDAYRRQIHEVLCGETAEYAEEREKLRTMAENSLIVLIPLLMSALNIPTSAAGIAVILSLLVLKIGLRTLCNTRGDLSRLRGKPGSICQVSGTYINILTATSENVYKSRRFPEGPRDSIWIFSEELPQESA